MKKWACWLLAAAFVASPAMAKVKRKRAPAPSESAGKPPSEPRPRPSAAPPPASPPVPSARDEEASAPSPSVVAEPSPPPVLPPPLSVPSPSVVAEPSPPVLPPPLSDKPSPPAASAQVSLGTHAPDSGESPQAQEVKPRVPWRGTALQMTQGMTTSLLGVGGRYQSSAYRQLEQTYALLLNYYVVDRPEFKVRVATRPSVSLELTNSDTTTRQHEPVFNNLPVTAVGLWTLHQDEQAQVQSILLGNFTATLPTSKFSPGEIVGLSPRLTFMQALPLAGRDAPVFSSILLGVGGRYDGLISKATVQTSDAVARIPRQTGTGGISQVGSDVLTGARVAPHAFQASAFAFFSEEAFGTPLFFTLAAFYRSALLYDAAGSRYALPTGPVEVPSTGRGARQTAGVDVSLVVVPMTELAFVLGYQNAADLRGPSPNPLYAPTAQFQAGLSVNLDAIYEGATGPRRTVPFVLF